MRPVCTLLIAAALLGSSLLYANQLYSPGQDNKNTNRITVDPRSIREGAQSQNQNTKQGTSPGGPGGGGTSSGGGSGPRHRAAMIANDASRVLDEIMSNRDKSIPLELLDQAAAIAIFPAPDKVAFIAGGGGGEGVISRRVRGGGWGVPAFFNLRGGSFSTNIGAQKSDYVLLIMNDAGINAMLREGFELGNVAAGPVGREAAASTNPRIDAGILSYSRSRGLFSGVALKGAVISPDDDLNNAIYRRNASDLFSDSQFTGPLPAEVRKLTKTLARYSRR